MKGFIEVPWKYIDSTITRLVNIQHIVMVEEYEARTEIYLTPGESSVRTDLSYEEVKNLIFHAQK